MCVCKSSLFKFRSSGLFWKKPHYLWNLLFLLFSQCLCFPIFCLLVTSSKCNLLLLTEKSWAGVELSTMGKKVWQIKNILWLFFAYNIFFNLLRKCAHLEINYLIFMRNGSWSTWKWFFWNASINLYFCKHDFNSCVSAWFVAYRYYW